MTTFSLSLLLLALIFPLVVLTTAFAYIRCVLTKPLPRRSLKLASTLSLSQRSKAYVYNQTNALAHALSIGHHDTSQPVLCCLCRHPLLQDGKDAFHWRKILRVRRKPEHQDDVLERQVVGLIGVECGIVDEEDGAGFLRLPLLGRSVPISLSHGWRQGVHEERVVESGVGRRYSARHRLNNAVDAHSRHHRVAGALAGVLNLDVISHTAQRPAVPTIAC